MSEDFGYQIMREIPIVENRKVAACYDFFFGVKALSVARAAAACKIDGDWAQFGVWKGDTANVMLDLLPLDRRLFLFDTFTGLERDWVGQFKKGAFALDYVPDFKDDRVHVVPGFFADTARDTLAGKEIAFVHIDCDLYESTLDALYSLSGLRRGAIILFDEYVHRLDGQQVDDEYRAFMEWTRDTKTKFRYLWRTRWTQVCVEIL